MLSVCEQRRKQRGFDGRRVARVGEAALERELELSNGIRRLRQKSVDALPNLVTRSRAESLGAFHDGRARGIEHDVKKQCENPGEAQQAKRENLAESRLHAGFSRATGPGPYIFRKYLHPASPAVLHHPRNEHCQDFRRKSRPLG